MISMTGGNPVMRIDAHRYWQHRVEVLSKNVIDKKMQRDGVNRAQATESFRKWIFSELGFEVISFETLQVPKCKAIVALMHRHSIAA